MGSYYPNLTGKIHPEAEKAVTDLYTAVYGLQGSLASTTKTVDLLSTPGAPSQSLLHPEDRAFIANSLQANGETPLNVTNLLGQLAQPQAAKVQTILTSVGTTINVANPSNGQLVISNGQLFQYISGVPGQWVAVDAQAVILQTTYANWTAANFPLATLPTGLLVLITDWNVIYSIRVVGGVNAWVYLSGVYSTSLANLPTTGFDGTALGTNDTGLLFFENVTYFHQVRWSGSGWVRGPQDLDHANTFVDFGAAPTDPGWLPCDGSTQNYFNYTNPASPGSIVLPNLVSTPAYSREGSVYSPAVTAAVDPTVAIAPYTPAGTVGGSGGSAPTGTVDAGTGAPDTFVTSVTFPTETFSGTPHTLTGTVSLPGDPIANWSVVRYFRQ